MRPVVLFIASLLALFGAGCDGGEQLIEVHVERNGEPVLRGQYGVGRDETTVDAWRQIADKQLKSTRPIDWSQGERGILTGKLRLCLRHAGGTIAVAELEHLRIEPVSGTDYWTISASEVARTAKAAGF